MKLVPFSSEEPIEIKFFPISHMNDMKKKDFSQGKTWRKNSSFVLSFIKAR